MSNNNNFKHKHTFRIDHTSDHLIYYICEACGEVRAVDSKTKTKKENRKF
jgi:RNase P subunit RPR2